MKYIKRSIPVIVLLVAVIIAALLVHPVRVYSTTSYSYRIMVTGVKNYLDGIGDVSGGYRCYLDENHYVFLSRTACVTVADDDDIYLQYKFPWEPTVLNRGGAY